MIEAVSYALEGIGYAMFSTTFILSVWLLYVMNRKLNFLDFYRTVTKKPYLYLISDIILQSLVAGVIISMALVLLGVPLYYNDMLKFIVPVSILLSTFRLRFLCLTYSVGIMSMLSLLFNGQMIMGYELPYVEIHVPSALILVGLLHMVEGVLIVLFGHQRAVPVLSKKDNRVLMGHIIQKTWAVPLSVIVASIGIVSSGGTAMPEWWPIIKYTGYSGESLFFILPLIAFSSYTTIFYNETPKERTRFSGFSITLFGILTVLVARFSMDSLILQFAGILVMVMIHELVYFMEKRRETGKEPVYIQPEKGIRIMDVLEGGYGEEIGLRKGDVIEKIDEESIENINHYMKVARSREPKAVVTVRRINGESVEYEVKDRNHLEHLGIRVVPEKPLFLYPYDKFSYVGIFEFLKR